MGVKALAPSATMLSLFGLRLGNRFAGGDRKVNVCLGLVQIQQLTQWNGLTPGTQVRDA